MTCNLERSAPELLRTCGALVRLCSLVHCFILNKLKNVVQWEKYNFYCLWFEWDCKLQRLVLQILKP